MLIMFEATRVAISTCGQRTSFDSRVALHDGMPDKYGGNTSTLVAQGDSDMPCVLIYDVPAASTLYLTVEGVREHEVGVFETSVLCQSLEAPPVEDSCDRQVRATESSPNNTTAYHDNTTSPQHDIHLLIMRNPSPAHHMRRFVYRVERRLPELGRARR